jgi:glycosyltransferase involved in cell wall biosynthesis
LKIEVKILRKVVFVNNSFFAKGDHTSGGDERFKIFVKDCEKRSIGSTVISSWKFNKQLIGSNLEVVNSPRFLDKFNIYACYLLRMFWLTFKLSTIQNSIIISSSDQIPDTIPMFINKFFRNHNNLYASMSYHIIPSPTKRMGNKFNNFLSYISQLFFFHYSNNLEAVVVPSEYYRDTLLKMPNFKSNPIVLPMRIYKPEGFVADIETQKKYECIYLGRMAPNKGISSIPLILKAVNEQINIRCVFVGQGQKKHILELKDQLRSERIDFEFAGFVDEELKMKLLLTSKCLILPSKEEGFSMAISEALFAGIEVVAWDLPSLRAIYGESIKYAKIDDINDFSNQIMVVLSGKKMQNVNRSAQLRSSLEHTQIENDFYKYLVELSKS